MVEEYQKLYSETLALLERDWGERCETKDTEDFPDLKGQNIGRCPSCLVYEKFDEFWRAFGVHLDDR